MMRATRQSKAGVGKAQISIPMSVPAPVGGLNARDGYTVMGPTDAVTLDNLFPEAQYIVSRGGSVAWKSGMTNPVRSLLVWNGPTGTDKMFAAAGTSFWDVSASGGSASTVVTGLSNAIWQWTNITTSAGNYLISCNGADAVYSYDGTTWAHPAITVADPTLLIQVTTFKQRLWFAQTLTLDLWYMPTASIAGAATKFPLGSVFRRGGYIVGVSSFSRDAGDGPDDFLAVLTSNGEVAVYEGTDPSSANTFGLSGVFNIGNPLGRRAMARWNGDLAIVTSDGVVSMLAMLQYDRASDQKAAITAKIQTLFSQASKDYGSYFGWQILIYPKSRYVIVNYPVVADTTQKQFVMNTVTGAWCTFSALNGGCWAVANDKLYFGGNAGVVYQADTLYSDSNADIQCDMKTAWSNFGIPEKKMVTALKPILLTGGGVDYQHKINFDFDDTPPSGTVSATPVIGAVWDMTWNFTWGGATIVDARWHGVGGVGVWAAIRFKFASNGSPVQVNAFSVLLQRGGEF